MFEERQSVRNVFIPQLLANEDRCTVVDIEVQEGQFVAQGEKLCSFETSKTVFDFFAEVAGYVRKLQFKEGDEAKAGDLFCYLTEKPDEAVPDYKESRKHERSSMKATNRALQLIEAHQIPLECLPQGRLIKEKDVQMIIQNLKRSDPKVRQRIEREVYPKNAVLLVGAGGHASVCLDLIKKLNVYEPVGIIAPDDESFRVGETVSDVPIIGCDSDLPLFRHRGIPYAVNSVGGTENPSLRQQLYDRLKDAGFEIPTLIHPDATVESSAVIGPGAQIMPKCVIASHAQIHANVLVNTGAIISHHCVVKAHSHIAPGALLGGFVEIGERTLVGMGVTIYFRIRIGNDVVIPNGTHIFSDITSGTCVKRHDILNIAVRLPGYH